MQVLTLMATTWKSPEDKFVRHCIPQQEAERPSKYQFKKKKKKKKITCKRHAYCTPKASKDTALNSELMSALIHLFPLRLMLRNQHVQSVVLLAIAGFQSTPGSQ